MTYPVQYAPINSVVYFPFATYGKTSGQSVTLSGFTVTDIEVYKLPSMVQRASDSGYALLDTDGIDLDGVTGIHGFSINLADNADAGFFVVGEWYMVIAAPVTIDGETVNFIAGLLRVMETENPSGVPDVNVTHWKGSPVALPSIAGVPEVDVTHNNGVTITLTLPTNFALLVVDSAGNVNSNIKKINSKAINTSVKPFDVEP